MIVKIKGTLDEVTPSYAVIFSAGVGYRVFMTPDAITELKSVGGEIELWTYHVIREDLQELFGFSTREGLEFFEMLLKVPGIGPRSALAIMGVATLQTLKKAISSGDVSYMTKVSGIGRKTAEKVVLELKDRLGSEESSPEMKTDLDVLEALKSLGYDRLEAREVVTKIPENIRGTSERVKEALKILSKNHH